MRTLSIIGSCLVIFGIYVFTSGGSGSRYALPGGVIVGAGLIMLAFAAAVSGLPEVSDD